MDKTFMKDRLNWLEYHKMHVRTDSAKINIDRLIQKLIKQIGEAENNG